MWLLGVADAFTMIFFFFLNLCCFYAVMFLIDCLLAQMRLCPQTVLMLCDISHHKQTNEHKHHLPHAACMALWGSLSPACFGLVWLQTVHSTGAHPVCKCPAEGCSPFLLAAGRGWAQTAGNHMTHTVETMRGGWDEKRVDRIPSGSRGPQGVPEPWE